MKSYYSELIEQKTKAHAFYEDSSKANYIKYNRCYLNLDKYSWLDTLDTEELLQQINRFTDFIDTINKQLKGCTISIWDDSFYCLVEYVSDDNNDTVRISRETNIFNVYDSDDFLVSIINKTHKAISKINSLLTEDFTFSLELSKLNISGISNYNAIILDGDDEIACIECNVREIPKIYNELRNRLKLYNLLKTWVDETTNGEMVCSIKLTEDRRDYVIEFLLYDEEEENYNFVCLHTGQLDDLYRDRKQLLYLTCMHIEFLNELSKLPELQNLLIYPTKSDNNKGNAIEISYNDFDFYIDESSDVFYHEEGTLQELWLLKDSIRSKTKKHIVFMNALSNTTFDFYVDRYKNTAIIDETKGDEMFVPAKEYCIYVIKQLGHQNIERILFKRGDLEHLYKYKDYILKIAREKGCIKEVKCNHPIQKKIKEGCFPMQEYRISTNLNHVYSLLKRTISTQLSGWVMTKKSLKKKQNSTKNEANPFRNVNFS